MRMAPTPAISAAVTEFDPTLYGASIADKHDDLYFDSLDTALMYPCTSARTPGPV